MCVKLRKHLHAVYIVNFNDKQLATYKAHQAIEYLRNLLEYNSSQDPRLKFQNGGSGAWQLRQGFSMKAPIMDTPFRVATSQVYRRVQ